jgi:hypothetical protein
MLVHALAALALQSLPHTPDLHLTGRPDQLFAAMSRMTGDIDGDGGGDVLVYAVTQRGPLDGRVLAYSGTDGSLLHAFGPVGNSPIHPGALDGAGDVDGDGHEDVIVGNSLLERATVYSGANGSILLELAGYGTDDGFGGAVRGAGDFDGDGHADVLVGTTQAVTGYAVLYSGRDGSILQTFRGETPGDQLGLALAPLGDVDGDGFGDVAIGALGEGRSYLHPGFPPFVPPHRTDDDAGGVLVFSGKDGRRLYTVLGGHSRDGFGYSLDAAGDVNGDGITDFVAGTSSIDNPEVPGYARVVSGADGAVLHTLLGAPGTGAHLVQVAGAGDVDGDLVPDVLVGARQPGPSCAAQVVSGATGLELFCYLAPASSAATTLITVDGGHDLDADGVADFLIGVGQAAFGAGLATTFVSGL